MMSDLPSLRDLERRFDRLEAEADRLHGDYAETRAALAEVRSFLDLAPKAAARLEILSKSMFGEVLDDVERNLTLAIREILGQERTVVSDREIRDTRLSVVFSIENQGRRENILRGQGGSVCNILSVGLRLIALSQLDERRHRPFLVLDEQDCWLKPELVPNFMGIIAAIAERLGIQVLVISHHPVDLFARDAKRIYALRPRRENGVDVILRKGPEKRSQAEPADHHPCADAEPPSGDVSATFPCTPEIESNADSSGI